MTNNKPIAFFSSFLFLGTSLVCANTYAAQAIDLSHQPASLLRSFAATPAAAVNPVKMEEVSRSVDFNQTLHVRVQETYQGHPVLGGDAVIHIPQGVKTAKSFMAVANALQENKGSMNGTVYQDLQADLAATPISKLQPVQGEKALSHAIKMYQQTEGAHHTIKNEQTKLIVYLDKNKKAHWAYQVNFYAFPTKAGEMPAKPLYILDALTFDVYKQWNDIKTLDNVMAGGFGGNKKMGKLIYDGLNAPYPKLQMQRDAATQTCYVQNDDVTVQRFGGEVLNFPCTAVSVDHDQIYWNESFDMVNSGYSPANDALYAGRVIKDMYQSWYGIPVLVKPDGTAMQLKMIVHIVFMDNAFWDDVEQRMLFGDGQYYFYPLTSLGVGAHEISHGFTNQHSNLIYTEQSGGMNEAFSDMAAQAAEFFAYGKSSWQIGGEIYKLKDRESLRYMDKPTKDCKVDEVPGLMCSIDHASQYVEGKDMNVHYTSGVYNRAFYLLANTPGWDTKKAFDVMVKANRHYWTANSTFAQGACGVVKAARDHQFNEKDVVNAFKEVGVSATC